MAGPIVRLSVHVVAGLVGLDWKTVKRIDKKYIQQTLTKLYDLSPTHISVDEVAFSNSQKRKNMRPIILSQTWRRTKNNKYLVLEVKGQEKEQDKAKHASSTTYRALAITKAILQTISRLYTAKAWKSDLNNYLVPSH